MDDCKKYNTSTVGKDPVLAITSERKTVRLLDMKLGVESWNWSIASVDVQYLGVKERSSCLPPLLDFKFNFDVQKGNMDTIIYYLEINKRNVNLSMMYITIYT